ncbi:MAG: hypothetical protein KC656_05840 [Myxococcales bacterium]|nr:hypothetical protein [Myxococcales bacterium]
MPLLSLLGLIGCTDPTSPSTTDTDTGSWVTTSQMCTEPPRKSACDNQASIVQGHAHVPDGVGPTTGTLVIAMMHAAMGDPDTGGHPHWLWTFPDVDLSEPVPFRVDMCEGNAIMWSEENCGFNLIALLDTNGDNGLSGPAMYHPGVGEPTTLVPFDLSCHAEGATCLGTLELDCTDGDACLQTASPGMCTCASDSCESEAAICEL